MPIPFPYDAVAGAQNDPAEDAARILYDNFKWIARLVDEMNAEEQQDLKRTLQFVLHARRFQAALAALTAMGDGAVPVIAGYFAMKRVTWPSHEAVLSDLEDLAARVMELADWFDANTPAYKDGYTVNRVVGISEDGVLTVTDEAVKAEKPAELIARLSQLRQAFGEKP